MKNITLTLISIAHFAFTQAQFSIIEIDYTSDFGGAPSPIAEYNGMVYLRAQVNNMDGLWKTDGTQNGTQLVKQVAPFRFRSVKNGILYNNKFYFYSYQTGASCLWESDGTTNGTKKT